MLNDRLICVFTNINLELKKPLSEYENAPSKIKSSIETDLLSQLNYYAIPLCVKTHMKVVVLLLFYFLLFF